jgi:hypothetical protein
VCPENFLECKIKFEARMIPLLAKEGSSGQGHLVGRMGVVELSAKNQNLQIKPNLPIFKTKNG